MPAKYRVAAQMFGFRDYTKTLEDAAKTMKRVKRIGYDYCQVSGFGPMDMADLKRVCDDAGVTPIGAHISLPQFRENERKVLEDCRKLGISYVAIPWLKASDQKTLADWKALFREFEGYAKRFAKEGVTVQYHNHAFEFQKFGIKGGKGGRTILDMFSAAATTPSTGSARSPAAWTRSTSRTGASGTTPARPSSAPSARAPSTGRRS